MIGIIAVVVLIAILVIYLYLSPSLETEVDVKKFAASHLGEFKESGLLNRCKDINDLSIRQGGDKWSIFCWTNNGSVEVIVDKKGKITEKHEFTEATGAYDSTTSWEHVSATSWTHVIPCPLNSNYYGDCTSQHLDAIRTCEDAEVIMELPQSGGGALEYSETIKMKSSGNCEIRIKVKDIIEGSVSLPYSNGEATTCTIPSLDIGQLITPSMCTGELFNKINQYTSAYIPEDYGVELEGDKFDCRKSVWEFNDTAWADCLSDISKNIKSCKTTSTSMIDYPQSGDGLLGITIRITKEYEPLPIRQAMEKKFENDCEVVIQVYDIKTGSVELPYEKYENTYCTIPAEHISQGLYENQHASCTGDLIERMTMHTTAIPL